MTSLLESLRHDYPELTFTSSPVFFWSPKDKTIGYKLSKKPGAKDVWSLLHEIGHARLGHATYHTDFELLGLELDAWHNAQKLAKKYGQTIDDEHVQDCLDTYRDWLYVRSTCPRCSQNGLQIDGSYTCINCHARWDVPASPLCRIYRKPLKQEAEIRN